MWKIREGIKVLRNKSKDVYLGTKIIFHILEEFFYTLNFPNKKKPSDDLNL